MKTLLARKGRRLLWPALASLTVTCALTSPAVGNSDTNTPQLSTSQRAAATQLAADNHISAQEAQQRILRQDRLTDIATSLRGRLGSRFGGAWIDQEHGGRLTVAVTQPTTVPLVKDRAKQMQAPDTATVVVGHSLQELDRISARLAQRIAAVNKGAAHGLQSAVVVQDNKVRLDLPQGAALSRAQRSVVQWAQRTFGDALTVSTYAHASSPSTAAASTPATPAALRPGHLRRQHPLLQCVHGVQRQQVLHDDRRPLRGRQRVLAGPHVQLRLPDSGQRGRLHLRLLRRLRHRQHRRSRLLAAPRLGLPSTRITSWDYDYVGQYVCKEGSTTGYTCGQVTETNATVSYPNRTLTGMTWSTACDGPGDSGSGVYNGSTAHGILSGGPSSGCGMIHEPISRALSDRGVTLLAG